MLTHSPENQDWLRAKWLALTASVSADRAAADGVWDELIRHYSEPHRAYHNLSHITMLLRHAETHQAQIALPEIVEFSIWFHDVIYDTHLKDNELRSAEWARRAMIAMLVDERHIPPVMECIAATEQHEITSSRIADLPLFLDIDLAILGAKEEIYQRYSDSIRAEYDWVPIDQYRAGRGNVLRRFLDRPSLFFTAEMAACFEEQARTNLAAELQQISTV
jgi:predicted metal-dependent HD superfamily phosphohydrolase